jgi:hypothetical protein
MDVDVSAPARRFIAARGGALYVYFTDVGRSGWVFQRVKLARPADREFTLHESESIRLWLDADFTAPATLKVRRRPWPVGPIQVTGTGVGQFDLGGGGGGGDGGWSWPTGGHGGGDGGGHGGGGHGGGH